MSGNLGTARLSRRALLGATAAAVPAAMLVGCSEEETAGKSDNGSMDEVTYLTAFGVPPRESYAHVAQAKGFFAEANISVTIEPGAAGDANHQAISGGVAQFAAVDSSQAFIRYARAVDPASEGGVDDFQILAAANQLLLMAMLNFADLEIRRPTDLEGRTVGLAAGSTAETLWPVYAELAGIDITKVETVPTSPQTQVQEFIAGQLDSFAQFVVSRNTVEAAAGGREVATLPWSDVISDLYGNVIIGSKQVIAEQPDLTRRFVTAITRGLEYMVDNPEECGEILHEVEPTQDPKVAAVEMELLRPYVKPEAGKPVGAMEPDRVARAVALLQSTGILPATAGLTYEQDIMGWEFVPGAESQSEADDQ